MTDPSLKLPFGRQPEMAGTTALLAGQPFFDPHISIKLFACKFHRETVE
jgi:hypothetical protein